MAKSTFGMDMAEFAMRGAAAQKAVDELGAGPTETLDNLRARIVELEAIADVASLIDVLWGTDDDDDGMDDAEFCEAIDKLRVVLRPWRQRRATCSPSEKIA